MKRSSKEIKRISRDMLNNRYSVPMGAFVAAGLIPALIEIPFSLSSGDYPSTPQLIITTAARFLILLIGQMLLIGVFLVHLNMTRKKEFHIVQIFQPFREGTDRYFGAVLLYTLLLLLAGAPAITGILWFYSAGPTASSAVILTVTCLLSIILIVAFMLNFQLIYLFLLDDPQMKVTAAFGKCRRLMKGNKKRLFSLFFGFLGWGGLIACSFGIAALWAAPYMIQVLVTFYLDCTEELDQIPVREYGRESGSFTNLFF